MSLGSESAGVSSRKVIIEADGVCSVCGRKALRLQESEKSKAKKSKGKGEAETSTHAEANAVYDEQIQLVDQTTGRPLADCPYVILQNDEVVARGRTDRNGMTVRVASGNCEAEMTLLWGDDALDWS